MASIFSNIKDPKTNSEELLYEAIREELNDVLIQWYSSKIGDDIGSSVIMNPQKYLKKIGDITLQFVWKKMGMKKPQYSRNEIDDDCNIIGTVIDSTFVNNDVRAID